MRRMTNAYIPYITSIHKTNFANSHNYRWLFFRSMRCNGLGIFFFRFDSFCHRITSSISHIRVYVCAYVKWPQTNILLNDKSALDDEMVKYLWNASAYTHCNVCVCRFDTHAFTITNNFTGKR